MENVLTHSIHFPFAARMQLADVRALADVRVLADDLLVSDVDELCEAWGDDSDLDWNVCSELLVRDAVFLFMVDVQALRTRLEALGLDSNHADELCKFVTRHVEDFRAGVAPTSASPWVEFCVTCRETETLHRGRVPLAVMQSLNDRVRLNGVDSDSCTHISPLLTHFQEILLRLCD